MLSADDFKQQLKKLLPYGPAWDTEESLLADKMVEAWAQEYARIHADIERLVEEADPRTTLELLSDYERIFGLPTDCMVGIDQTIQQRRNALIAQMVSVGGQSRAYFTALAAAAGYTISITEFSPHTFLADFAYPFYGTDWAYAWQVNGVSFGVVIYFFFNGGFNEPFASWDANLLTCLINRFKPAHTVVLYI